jgi:hypothetical protein
VEATYSAGRGARPTKLKDIKIVIFFNPTRLPTVSKEHTSHFVMLIHRLVIARNDVMFSILMKQSN